MENLDILCTICLGNKNVTTIIEVIRDDVKLSERSIPKCAALVKQIMKHNIGKLNRPPKNRQEIEDIAKHLNKLCVKNIIDIIIKKYPDTHINKKKQLGKEQMRRDMDVWGNRPNHVQDRPYTKTKKQFDDEDEFYSMKPNDIGFSGQDSASSYASAFGNHMITNVPAGQKQTFKNPHAEKDVNRFEQQYSQYMNDRNYGINQRQQPEEIDFTLDNSGDKVRRNKEMKKAQEYAEGFGSMGGMGGVGGMQSMGGMGGMQSMGGMGEMGMCMVGGLDNDYASLLGAGAPNQMSQMPQQTQQTQFNQLGQLAQLNQLGQQSQFNPGIGMGNPLMPMSSTNMIADQMGMSNMNSYGNYGMGNGMENGMGCASGFQQQSAKSIQLTNDLERKKAERQMIDTETNQPVQNSNPLGTYGMDFTGMQNLGGNGMGMQGFGMDQMNQLNPMNQINTMNPMNPMNPMNQMNQMNPMNPMNTMNQLNFNQMQGMF